MSKKSRKKAPIASATPSPAACPSVSSRSGFILERLLLLVALGISLYLAWHSFRSGGVPGCGPDSECDKVLGSPWAYFLGLPISVFAVPIYATLLVVLTLRATNWCWVTGLSATIAAAAIYFVGLQIFVVQAFCKFCMAAHIAGGVAAGILLWKSQSPQPKKIVRIALGAGAVVIVFAVQALFSHKAAGPVQIVSTNTLPAANAAQLVAAQPAAPVVTNPPTIVSMVDGQFSLQLGTAPTEGPVNARFAFAKLVDYTCHHCRHLHHLLHEYLAKSTNSISVLTLPMPLETTCNKYVRRQSSTHMNACEYARLGIAVYFADPPKFAEYNKFIFGPERPPAIEQARAYAGQLVGNDRLNQTLSEARVEQQLQQNIEIYAANSRIANRFSMPQLLFTGGSVVGSVATMQDLENILAQHLR